MDHIQVKVLDSRIGQEFHFPRYATDGSAGLDLIACIDEPQVIEPMQTLLIPTGLAIYIEDKRYAGLIMPRSGLGHKHGIVLGNTVGLIDSDYQGELKISCLNRSENSFVIEPGLRLAQLVIMPVSTPQWKVVTDFEKTERGEGGFGHTGKKEFEKSSC